MTMNPRTWGWFDGFKAVAFWGWAEAAVCDYSARLINVPFLPGVLTWCGSSVYVKADPAQRIVKDDSPPGLAGPVTVPGFAQVPGIGKAVKEGARSDVAGALKKVMLVKGASCPKADGSCNEKAITESDDKQRVVKR